MKAATDHIGKRSLYNRAKSKWLSYPIATALTQYAKENGFELEQAYRDTVYCADNVVQHEDGSLRGHYCGRRWCMVCNRIRMAKTIEAYMPSIDHFEDAHFVTLTRRAVPAGEITQAIDENLRVFNLIVKAMRYHRTDPVKLEAVRKLEITYNESKATYHIHYHVVVRSYAMGKRLLSGWLSRMGDKAVRQAQDIRPVTEGALVELFKYATKLVTKAKDGRGRFVPVDALDNIFTALHGRRTLQPVGFKLKRVLKDEEAPLDVEGRTEAWKRIGEAVLWQWEQEIADWIDYETGETLTDYRPPEALEQPENDTDQGAALDTLEITLQHEPSGLARWTGKRDYSEAGGPGRGIVTQHTQECLQPKTLSVQ